MPAQLKQTAAKVFAGLIGFVLFAGGLGMVAGIETYWRRVVTPEREKMATATSISADKLDPQNDGKLVHVTGLLSGAEKLADPDFGVAVDALLLRRRVWMRQWEQGRRTGKSTTSVEDMKTHETTTLWKSETYNYSEVWSEKVINSRDFYNRGHDNPEQKRIPDRAVVAAKISLGAFALAPKLAEQIDNFQPVPVEDKNFSSPPAPFRGDAKIADGEIYFGANPQRPAIGDLKVKLEFAPAATASVIARQDGDKLMPYSLSKAASVALLRVGSHSIQEMTQQFTASNRQSRIGVWCMGGIITLLGGFMLLNANKVR